MSKLEMLTEAADLVESKNFEEGNGKTVNRANGIAAAESNEKSTRNGTHESTSKSGAELLPASNNNYHDKGIRDDSKPFAGRNVERTPALGSNLTQDSQRLYNYQQRVGYTENTNGTLSQTRQEHIYRKRHEDNISPSGKSPDRFQANIQRRSTSPASDRGSDNHSTTKPMVLLQPSAATTLPSIVSAHATRIPNPAGIPIPAMHHPYMYHPLLYQSPAGLDSVLATANSRAPGVLKESEGLVSSPSRVTSDGLTAATTAGLHIPGLVYPLVNHPAALLMGARPHGAEMPPVVLGQPTNPYPAALDQYKRMFEGLQFSPYSGLNPQLTDQYLKSLAAAQGLDTTKDPLALSMMARLPAGMSLAAPSGADLLRYPEHWPAAMSILRPPDGMSPRSGSPFAVKRRTESPIVPNGSKTSAPSYPFHHALVQSQINNLTAGRNLSRSPATLLPQGPRSRSPPVEARKPEVERSGYRSHSRDLDREIKPAVRELASASATNNGRGRNNSSEQVPPYSVTDENGRKIPVPAFYGQPAHIPYAGGMPPHHMTRERSPSPRPRDERGYHRPQRDRSPIGVEAKRRSLEGHHLARDSPVISERHNSRPSSPLSNGLMQAARSKMSVVNGNTEATVAAELSKHNPHLLLPASHTRSPNPAGFGVDGREQRNSNTSPPNPYLVAGVPPFFNPHLIPGLGNHPGAHYMLSPQYAQALAAKSGVDLSSLYKTGENAEYARLAGLQLLQQQQQQLLAGVRPPGLPSQDYVAALKNAAYFSSQMPPKDGGKSSPANVREKLQVPPTQMHSTLAGQVPPKAQSPPKVGLKQPLANDSPQMGKSAHHSRPETHSPTGNSNLPPADTRRYHQSPNVGDRERPSQEVSPKQQQSSKPYRPNSMLRQHASDLERSRKRKMMEEELAMREDSNAFVREKHRNERDYHSKDERKDPKRVKQLISENDPEEHFRRSLGKDYKETSNKIDISGSVDEHFKKALGPRYEQLHAAGTKLETRDTNSSSSHHLPPYSVAVAAASQSNRMYSHPDVKEPPTRYYDQPFLTRERYYHQTSPHHNKKTDRSPPRSQPGGTTVLYPQNPAVVPARQKVKAKAAFIPEASEPHKVARTGRTSSDGGKGSARSMSGGSMENIPAVLAKSPPTTSPPAVTTSDAARPTAPPVIPQGIPYTYAHQANASGGHVEAPTSNNAVSQRIRNSPTSSSRNLDQDEQTKILLSGSPTRGYSAPAPSNHRESTESMGKEGKGST